MDNRLKEELKQAQLARDGIKVSTLRLLLSEINNLKIQKGKELEEADFIAVIKREAKKRKEAAEGFRKGGNEERASKEELELKILESYLPEEIDDRELTNIVMEVINELGAKNIQDMGKVMSAVMGKVGAFADGAKVSAIVKDKLS